jgi:hypothetical protein
MGRICAGSGNAPLNSTSRCRGASAPRSGFPFAAAPQARGRGAPTRRTRLKRRARTARQPRSRGAARTLRSVRAPLGAPHGGFGRGPALHRRRCRRIRRAHCARPGVAPGERGPEPPEPAVSAAAPDATPALSSGSSPETPLIERDGRGYSMSPLRSQYLSSIYSQKKLLLWDADSSRLPTPGVFALSGKPMSREATSAVREKTICALLSGQPLDIPLHIAALASLPIG